MRRRALVFMLTGVAIASLLGTERPQFMPRLLYNITPSVPVGWYWVRENKDLQKGDLVLFHLPLKWQNFAIERGYIGPHIPLLKPVFALEGDTVCRTDERITVNKTDVAAALSRDSLGREMPTWGGCFTLKQGEFFALNPDVQASFDGRYYSVLKTETILGTATPLLVWGASPED